MKFFSFLFIFIFSFANEKSSLSLKCLIYEMSYVWNVLNIKCPIYEMSSLWNVLSIKCPIYEMYFYEMSYLWNVFLWNVLSIKCLFYEISQCLRKFPGIRKYICLLSVSLWCLFCRYTRLNLVCNANVKIDLKTTKTLHNNLL